MIFAIGFLETREQQKIFRALNVFAVHSIFLDKMAFLFFFFSRMMTRPFLKAALNVIHFVALGLFLNTFGLEIENREEMNEDEKTIPIAKFVL